MHPLRHDQLKALSLPPSACLRSCTYPLACVSRPHLAHAASAWSRSPQKFRHLKLLIHLSQSEQLSSSRLCTLSLIASCFDSARDRPATQLSQFHSSADFERCWRPSLTATYRELGIDLASPGLALHVRLRATRPRFAMYCSSSKCTTSSSLHFHIRAAASGQSTLASNNWCP